jgi:hypothetical protein
MLVSDEDQDALESLVDVREEPDNGQVRPFIREQA